MRSETHWVEPWNSGHLIGVVIGQTIPPSKTAVQSHGAAAHCPLVQRYGVASLLHGIASGQSSMVALHEESVHLIGKFGVQVTAVGHSSAVPMTHDPSGHGAFVDGGWDDGVGGQSSMEMAQVASYAHLTLWNNGQVTPCGHSEMDLAQE